MILSIVLFNVVYPPQVVYLFFLVSVWFSLLQFFILVSVVIQSGARWFWRNNSAGLTGWHNAKPDSFFFISLFIFIMFFYLIWPFISHFSFFLYKFAIPLVFVSNVLFAQFRTRRGKRNKPGFIFLYHVFNTLKHFTLYDNTRLGRCGWCTYLCNGARSREWWGAGFDSKPSYTLIVVVVWVYSGKKSEV